MFSYTKRRNSETQGSWTAAKSLQLWSGAQHTQFFLAKSVLSRITRTWEGGVAKKWRVMTRGRGGHNTHQKWWHHLWTAPYCVSVHYLGGNDGAKQRSLVVQASRDRHHHLWRSIMLSQLIRNCKKILCHTDCHQHFFIHHHYQHLQATEWGRTLIYHETPKC